MTNTPFYHMADDTLNFFEKDRPVVTVENSAYNSAKLCGCINSAVELTVIDAKSKVLNDAQIDILNRICCIIVDSESMVDYTYSEIIKELRLRTYRVW